MQLILTIFIILDFTIAKNLTLHNRYDPQNRELLDVKFSGNTMIITGNLNGTEFYDICDSLNPVHLSNLEIPFGNQNRALPNFIAATSDSILYLSARHRGIAIVNISDPSNPQFIGMVPQPNNSNYYGGNLDASANFPGIEPGCGVLLTLTLSNPPLGISGISVNDSECYNFYTLGSECFEESQWEKIEIPEWIFDNLFIENEQNSGYRARVILYC